MMETRTSVARSSTDTVPPEPPASRSVLRWPPRLGASASIVAIAAIMLLIVVVEIATVPNFASWANLTNVLRSSSIPLVLAVGMTLVLISGGVDLSMAAVMSFTQVLYAALVLNGIGAGVAFVLVLVTGALIGFGVNGLLIGVLGMSFFVVTLGTMSLFGGLALLWANDRTIEMSGDALAAVVGNDAVLGGRVPISIVIALVAVGLTALVLRNTVAGRSIYAVGGNREAARLSGLRTGLITASVYGVSGLVSALAGVMLIGRSSIANPLVSTDQVLIVAAACLIAGVSLAGGVGSIWGATIGTAFFAVLQNALALQGLSNSWQLILTGVVLVFAVALDRYRQRRLAT